MYLFKKFDETIILFLFEISCVNYNTYNESYIDIHNIFMIKPIFMRIINEIH